MDINIESNPGTRNNFTQITIGHVKNVNPNVKEVTGHYVINNGTPPTKEERQTAFHSRAEIGNRRNNACLECEKRLLHRVKSGEITLWEAISLAWIEGEEYATEHYDELQLLHKK